MVISQPTPLASVSDLVQSLPREWEKVRPRDEIIPLVMATGADLTLQAQTFEDSQIIPLVFENIAGTAFTSAASSYGATWVCNGNELLNEDPTKVQTADSGAVGHLILQAVAAGVKHLVIRLGASLNHDAGIGMVRVLSGHHGEVQPEILPQLVEQARQQLRGINLVVAADYEPTFSGLDGAGAELVERAGLDPLVAQELERDLMPSVRAVEEWFKQKNLMASAAGVYPFTRAPFGGAGGGVAGMLASLGAVIQNTGTVSAHMADLTRHIRGVELAVVVVDELDGVAIGSGVVGQVTAALGGAITPVVVIARQAYASPRQYAQAGIHAVYEIERLHTLNQPHDAFISELSSRVQRVARNWSPES